MSSSKQLWSELLKETLAFSVLVASIVMLWRDNIFLFTVLLLESMVILSIWHDRYDMCFFLVIAGLGSLAEIVFVRFDVWHYTNPTFLGVPLWFPVSFGTSTLVGGRSVRTIAIIWDKTHEPHRQDEQQLL